MKAVPVLVAVMVALAWASSVLAAPKTGREYDGLVGPVQKVVVSKATLSGEEGETVEGQPWVTEIRTYNETGDVVEAIEFGRDGDPAERQVLTYDAATYASERMVFWPDGTVKGKFIFAYDDVRKLYAVQDYDADGTLRGKGTIILDHNGNVLESIDLDPDGRVLSNTTLTYNSVQQVESITFQIGISAPQLEVYSYDSKGNVQHRRDHNTDGSVRFEQHYEGYKLDARGNWIKRKIITKWYDSDELGSEKSYLIYRKITYYK